MSPLQELKALLSRKVASETMTVVSSTTSLVQATSRRGMVQLGNNGSLYVPGDNILVRDTVILGRVKREEDVPQYFI